MIESRMYIKSLNATETGESNTNDSYILVPRGLDASDFFGLTSGRRMFFDAIDPTTQKSYNLRFEITGTNEQRIYMLGVFCRDKGIHAGDTICLEKLTIDGNTKYYIRHRNFNNIVLLQKIKGSYVIERNDVGASLLGRPIDLTYNGLAIELTLSFKERGKKRNDSPDEFDFYEATLSSGQKLTDINRDSYVILDMDTNTIREFGQTKEYRIKQD